jgi:GNAT superfamily N-acetyltransferase
MGASKAKVRPIGPADLDRIVEIDQKITGHSRRGFYEKRFAIAARETGAFIGLAAETDGQIKGFVLTHILDGEFGGSDPVAVLDALGVDARARGAGVARTLMSALDKALKDRGVKELQTQAQLSDHELVGFFTAAGFDLAPRLTLERESSQRVDF